MRGMKEERETVGFKGLDDNSSIIITAAEQFKNLRSNRKINFYSKQRPTQDDSFFPINLLQVRERKYN